MCCGIKATVKIKLYRNIRLKNTCYKCVIKPFYPSQQVSGVSLGKPLLGRQEMSKYSKNYARQGLKGLLAGVSTLAVFTAFCAPAYATDAETKAEIRALKDQLRRLEHRLEAQAQNQRQTDRKVERVERGGVVAAAGGPQPVGVSKDGDAPWPSAFYFKAVKITPGGFFEFAALHRDRFIGADLATPFGQIPYMNNPTSHSDETRFTPRRSRFTLQTDADLDQDTHVREYFAADFLSAAQTATLTQSDSFNFRFRELYMKLDRSDYGLHFSAGQAYSLVGLNSRGTTVDTFLVPPVIDDQYMPGFTWSRQPGVRVSKDLPYNTQIAFGAEAAYVNYTTPAYAVNGLTAPYPGTGYPGAYNQLPVSGSLYNSANAVTFNDVPDLVTKASWDPDFAGHAVHFEGGGILRNLNDRTYGGNHDQWAGGAVAGVIVQVIPKWLDFQASGMSGNGIGRYGAASLADATFNWQGGPQAIHERQVMVGLTAHVTPQTDVYLFAGGEFAASNYSFATFGSKGNALGLSGNYAFGYGNPAYVNVGCNFEGAASSGSLTSCVGQTKDVRQVTTGIWHNFYDGPAGKVRVGAQYSYTVKDSFQGVGGAFKATENMIFTSVRYYPFN